MAETTTEEERIERWRLVLGKAAEETCGCRLGADALRMDSALGALYGDDVEKKGGLGSSSPSVARWLGDIRKYFPKSVVQVMQKDALERLNLQRMLMEPELLETVEPDIHLVTSILALSSVIPKRTRDSARRVVEKVVRELEEKLRRPTEQAVRGSLNRAERTRRPRPNEIDWDRTIRRNLKNYVPEKKTIIAEEIVGYASRRRSSLRDVILCVDQSGSMATSVVYSGVFGAVLASIRAVRTKMVLFDTEVVDLTEDLRDPVDLLFGARLGGGTDIHRALTYCEQLVERPAQTILVLITDLYEGGNVQGMRQRAASLVQSGVHVICLLALSDDGTPSYDARNAAAFAGLGIPTFGCTPEKFPDLMAAAIQKQDVASWAAREGIVTVREGDPRPG